MTDEPAKLDNWPLNGLTLLVALAANGLLFYALAWARSRPAPSFPQDIDIPRLVALAPVQSTPAPSVPEDPAPSPAMQRPADLQQAEFPPITRVAIVDPLDHLMRLSPMATDLPGMTVTLPHAEDLWRAQALPAPEIQGPLSAERVDRMPVKTAGPAPLYPAWARQRGLEAVVTLRFVITTSGTVTDLKIHDITGHESFGRAALDAVSQWRFQPALKQGKAVACWRFQKINFVRNP